MVHFDLHRIVSQLIQFANVMATEEESAVTAVRKWDGMSRVRTTCSGVMSDSCRVWLSFRHLSFSQSKRSGSYSHIRVWVYA